MHYFQTLKAVVTHCVHSVNMFKKMFNFFQILHVEVRLLLFFKVFLNNIRNLKKILYLMLQLLIFLALTWSMLV